jgi:hypothetical protein
MRTSASIVLTATALVLLSSAADARNDRVTFPLAGALRTSTGALDRVDTQIQVQFGGGRAGGAQVAGNAKVPLGGSNPKDACDRALRTAVSQMQSQAARMGATGVTGISSAHGGVVSTSGSDYFCGVGNVQTNVILRGSAVSGKGR